MGTDKAELKIGMKTFMIAVVILIALIVLSGVLTQVIPSGEFARDLNGTVIAGTYHQTNVEKLPVWRWVAAPVMVLGSGDGVMIIAIIMFLLIIGGSIHLLNQSGILKSIIASIVERYAEKKYLLLGIIIFVFMSVGSFIGIFEEVIPLIPIMIMLAINLGWDTMTGLGMTLLSTGVGFSAAVTNPFTVGIAQGIAGLPAFSGSFYRLFIFLVIYLFTFLFISRYAKRIDTNIVSDVSVFDQKKADPGAVRFFLMVMSIMLVTVFSSPFVPFIQGIVLPLIGLFFLIASFGSNMMMGIKTKDILRNWLNGAKAMSPGIVLILLATSVKYIIVSGGIMDTILYNASQTIENSSRFVALVGTYGMTMLLNFFIGSGSAKAFLMMPILSPLMDLAGVSRQLAVLAFQFGDGFSNILYPTNAVLLIGLGISNVSYTKWFKWIILFQVFLMLLSVVFLGLGLAIGYGV
ncbi:MAG: AbgT family transporter [Eubacteriales bacterium]|nr:AbgT family transporter [Eubacteriales bacterium]